MRNFFIFHLCFACRKNISTTTSSVLEIGQSDPVVRRQHQGCCPSFRMGKSPRSTALGPPGRSRRIAMLRIAVSSISVISLFVT